MQVGWHYDFYEGNGGLELEGEKGYGKEVEIGGGGGVGLEGGDEKEIEVVEYGGNGRMLGLDGEVNDRVDELGVVKV
ncbi:urease subunit beta, partial [Staphylococcus pettenkoferi]|uniref:urease subunit beta n=1 Tax=Staphylococcus pettenkoferi TaxID=170573 RepID=UPI0021B5A9DB